MTFSEWYGASANSITWDTTAAQIHAIGSIGTESIAQVQFQNTGFSIGSMTDSGTNNIQTTFLATTGTAEAAPYEIRWQYVTGNQSRWDPVNMSENVFYALSSTRVFNFTVISTSLVTGTFDITIRLIGDVGSEVTKRIVFSGEVESL